MKCLKFLCPILAMVLLLAAVLLFAGCEEKGPAIYTVSLKDYQGKAPTLPMLIELYQDGVSLGMKKVGEDGTLSFELERGDYTFVPRASGGEVYCNAADCVLTAKKTSAEVTVYAAATQKAPIYPHHGEDYFEYRAALVGEGATHVEIDRTDRAYYLFTPTRGGIYRFSCIADGEVTIGHFGEANVVLKDNVAQIEGNAFELEVLDSSVGTAGGGTLRVVIGLSAATVKDAVLVIERVGDPKPILPWTILTATQRPQDYIRSDALNHKLVNISVTDPSVKVVFSEADGYYHYGTEDGPIVYVRITSDSPYVASFTEICEAANMCRVFYDEAGEVVKKEAYNQLIMDYAEICDNNGVCPLTEELIYVLKNNGEHMGWWEYGANNTNIFTYTLDDKPTGITEATLIKENAWMFACCYVEEFAYGGEGASIVLTASDTLTYSAIVPESGALHFKVGRGTVLTIENATGLTVEYDGAVYTANESGKLVVSLKGTATALVVRASGGESISFDFTYRLAT